MKNDIQCIYQEQLITAGWCWTRESQFYSKKGRNPHRVS
jgi:hypothetical protein